MNNNYISLKFGTIRGWYFTDDFYLSNKELIDDFNELDDKLFENCIDMFSASELIKHNENLKLKLCNMLDNFYDIGVKIFNDFDNKTYKTKKSYRNYILNYGKGE